MSSALLITIVAVIAAMLASLGLAIFALVRIHYARSERDRALAERDLAARARSDAQAVAERAIETSKSMERRLERAQDNLQEVGRRLEASDARARQAERTASGMADLHAQLRESRTRVEELGRAVQSAQDSAEHARLRVAALTTRVRRAERALAAVGVEVADTARVPTRPQHRPASRGIVRQLLMDTGAHAAALVDLQGLVVFGAGRDAGVERIAVLGALFADLDAPMGAVLCEAPARISVRTPRDGTHLLRLPGSTLLVGVDNGGEAPMFALQQASLRLTGLPGNPPAVPDVPDFVPEMPEERDERLEAALDGWAQRWSVGSAVVLDHLDRPLASTSDADVGPIVLLRRELAGVYRRLQRDGWPLDQVEVRISGADGAQAIVQLVRNDLVSAAVVAVTSGDVPDRAIDELASTVRWHTTPAHTA